MDLIALSLVVIAALSEMLPLLGTTKANGILLRISDSFNKYSLLYYKQGPMDPLTLVLAVVAALSEILPVVGITNANGILHAAQQFMVHVHADSDCHVKIDVEANQSPQRPPPSQSSIMAFSSMAGTTTAAAAGGTTAGAGTTTAAPGAPDGPAAMTNLAAGPP
jgi:hypothetical protein